MAELRVLGTAASVPDANHDTVALLLRGSEGTILIDCGGSPLHKLARAGIALDEIRAVILTHYHADHLYGLPMLVQGLWLGGRQAPLPVYGPQQALEKGLQLLELFDLSSKDDSLSLEWHPIPMREGRRVLALGDLQITSTPVEHAGIDTVALRFDNAATQRAIVYSADTEPCSALVRLATGADLLLHEATGNYVGHSTPAQAAEVAREAGVSGLVLTHYPVHGTNLEAWRLQAAEFPGPVTLANDGDIYPL